MAFKKGQSGNPGGRPKVVAEVRAYAQKWTKEAVDALREIATSKKSPAQARVAAAMGLYQIAYGRPAQQIEISSRTEVNYVVRMPTMPQSIEEWHSQAQALLPAPPK